MAEKTAHSDPARTNSERPPIRGLNTQLVYRKYNIQIEFNNYKLAIYVHGSEVQADFRFLAQLKFAYCTKRRRNLVSRARRSSIERLARARETRRTQARAQLK